ncbi:MAG: DUF434 domain-containing protein [Candidatus Adiutricales bacterium]
MTSLLKAASDLRYLLDKNYDRKGAVTFVGNHYQLTKADREILKRGVYPDSVAKARWNKLLKPELLNNRPLAVDGHNVVITVESALLGRTLIASDDGLIRDTAGIHGSYRQQKITRKALELILNFLKAITPEFVLFLFDAPLSQSGELALTVTKNLSLYGLQGMARAVPVPEKELYDFQGPVASSDSVIIDRVKEPFDLAGQIIRKTLSEAKVVSLR